MFPEQVFQEESTIVPAIQVEVIRHVYLGGGVTCVHCKINGLRAKRLTQDIGGQEVNAVPVWNLDGRIVANWFALLIEDKYKQAIDGQTVVIYPDIL